MNSPWLHSVILASSSVVYNLSALVLSVEQAFGVPKNYISPVSVQYLALQLDPGAGAAQLSIGGAASMSPTDCGITIFAGQTWPIFSSYGSLIHLDTIYLNGNTNSLQVNVAFSIL
jgi:hypothetical protein